MLGSEIYWISQLVNGANMLCPPINEPTNSKKSKKDTTVTQNAALQVVESKEMMDQSMNKTPSTHAWDSCDTYICWAISVSGEGVPAITLGV